MPNQEFYELEILKYLANPELPSRETADIEAQFGFTIKQTNTLINSLVKKGYVKGVKGMSPGYDYEACEITERGRERIANNQRNS